MNLINTTDKIYIAGKGMVGKALKKAFLNKGYLNIFNPSREELNLLEISEVQKWFKKNNPEIVVISAAKVGGIFANNKYPADFILENLKIQTNLIESAWKYGVKRLLFLGSSCIYPKYANQPIVEEELLSNYLEPTNEPYAIAKIAGLKLCHSLRIQYGFDAITLMPTNLYGPGDNYHLENSHVLPALIRKFQDAKEKNLDKVTCWGTGRPKREFLYVNELGKACVFALERWDPDSDGSPKDKNGNNLDYLNVGTGKDITIKELANLVAKESGFSGKIIWDESIQDGSPRKLLNVERINKLGWENKISLKYGLKKTIEFYKKDLNDKLKNSSRY